MNALRNNRLVALAADICAVHAAVRGSVEAAAAYALTAGAALIEAKNAVPHEAWEAWLADNTAINARAARCYMQIAGSGLRTAIMADLGIRCAAESLAQWKREQRDCRSDPEYQAWAEEIVALLEREKIETLRNQLLAFILVESTDFTDVVAGTKAGAQP